MSTKSFNLYVEKKIFPFNKNIRVDSDKSVSIRSFLIGAISQDISYVKNVLESEDVISTIKCLKKLGIKILKVGKSNYSIYGKGLGSLYAKKNTELNFGNSGTLARLLIGILSTTSNIQLKIRGDHSLNERNMKTLIELMKRFGASFLPESRLKFPLKIISSNLPIGIQYKAGVSAQLKSAVIFAGLNSSGYTKVVEHELSRDHTENMLLQNTHAISIKKKKSKKKIKIYGKEPLKNFNIDVPGDPSSAAFFTALTLLNQKSSLKIKDVGLNPTRIGFYQILKKQGAKIQFLNKKIKNNELRGDILVKSHLLKPIKASRKYYVNSTDEYPILFVLAALSKGVSTFSGIGDLANKESNRITEMQKILKQLNIQSSSSKNELKIFGKGMINASNKKILVPDLGDHRICMSSFILAILTGAKAKIKNFETVYTSSPSFLKIMKSLGAKFEIQKK
ncbi:3-phosphoshikimate 1-carboxyvinyltransferase [Pelagibacteraceae bacterium]|nr:3-phosphoshikimate 1-carboxyvinyltransferase [Pelagibacteraceae bacterium]